MKEKYRVKNNELFNDIIKKGKQIRSKNFFIYYKDNDLEYPRFGIAVGTKVGKAVVRNKQKRRFRMLISNNKNLFQNEKDYIIIVKKACLNASYDELDKEIKNIMK